MTQIPIALQLYTVRDEAEKDLKATLAKVAEIGYRNVELAGFYGLPAVEIKKSLTEFGLNAISAHVGLAELEADNVGSTIEDYLSLGVETIVVPYLSEDDRSGGYSAVAERLNKAGELLTRFGVGLGYHNHDFEFRDGEDGKRGMDILIAKTDSSLITFELDTYWLLFSGVDPVQFITLHPTRFSLLHIKDLDAEDGSFAPIGAGLLPLNGIVEAAIFAGVRYLIVEQDKTKGPSLDAVEQSLNYLKSAGFA
jgi:sugar phosphate isomerase/epimerase